MASKKLTRTDVNFWLDTLLLMIFVALGWASIVVRYVFPPGTEAKGWLLWGWDYDQWSGLQFGLLSLLALGILVHVMLHWSWVCGVVASRMGTKGGGKPAARDDGSRTLWGVGLIIAIVNVVGLAVAAAMLSIVGPAA